MQTNLTASVPATATAVDSSLIERINTEHQACESALGDALQHAMAAGDLLITAKTRVPHGQWQAWLAENFAGSIRVAQLYMRLAANRESLQKRNGVAHLTLRQAQRQIADHRPKPGFPVPNLARGRTWVLLGTVGEFDAVLVLRESEKYQGYWYSQAWHLGEQTVLSMRPMRIAPANRERWLRIISNFEAGPFVPTGRWHCADSDADKLPMIDEGVLWRAYTLFAIRKVADFDEALNRAKAEAA